MADANMQRYIQYEKGNLCLSRWQQYVTRLWHIMPLDLKSFGVLFVHEGGIFQHIDSVIPSTINRMKRSCNESH